MNLIINRKKERGKVVFYLPAFICIWVVVGLLTSSLPQVIHAQQLQLKELRQPQSRFHYDLAVETVYVDQKSCEIHVVLKNSIGNIPESVYSQGKLKISSPSLLKISLPLSQVDPQKELNSKKQLDFNTKIILKQSETVKVVLEQVSDINPANNHKQVNLVASSHCQQRIPKQNIDATSSSSQPPSTTGTPGTIQSGLARPRGASFSFTVNGIAPPKTVYVYDYLPPATSGNLQISFSSKDTNVHGLRVEICDATGFRNVLKVIDISKASGRVGVDIAELYQLQQGGEWRTFYFRARAKLSDGSFSANSEEIRVIIGFVSKYYYYQDYATRGIQCMSVNGTLGPVLISGLTEDDREGRINVTFNGSVACSNRRYPVMNAINLRFYTTHEDGRIITPQSGYIIRVPAGQSSYSFTMKNLIQNMGLSWTAKVYFISVEADYQCDSQDGSISHPSEWDKFSNTVNIRFFAPLPLL